MFRLAGVLASVCTAGCVDLGIEDDRLTTLWNTELSPEPDFPGLTGQAAAVSQTDGTLASVLLQGAEPGTSYAWGLRLGACASPEQQIGPDSNYPELVVDDLGEATQNARLGPRLSLEQSYHVQVRVSTTDPSRVACGDLAGELAP